MKKFFKVVLGTGLGAATAIAIVNAVDGYIQRKKLADESRTIEAEKEETKRVIYLLEHLNKVNLGDFSWSEKTDGVVVPIIAYNAKLNLEHMKIPTGYTLLKRISSNESPSYALGRKKSDDILSVDYHILAVFVEDYGEPDLDI